MLIDTIGGGDSLSIDTTYVTSNRSISNTSPVIPQVFMGISYTIPDFDIDVIAEGYYDLENIYFMKIGVKKEYSKYFIAKAGFDGKYNKYANIGTQDLTVGFSLGSRINYNNFSLDIGYMNMGVVGQSFSLGLNYYLETKEEIIETPPVINAVEEDTIVNSDTLVQKSDTSGGVDNIEQDEKDEGSIKPDETTGDEAVIEETIEKKEDGQIESPEKNEEKNSK
jgi:hypothetical protein